jgi:hypothetical protein
MQEIRAAGVAVVGYVSAALEAARPWLAAKKEAACALRLQASRLRAQLEQRGLLLSPFSEVHPSQVCCSTIQKNTACNIKIIIIL